MRRSALYAKVLKQMFSLLLRLPFYVPLYAFSRLTPRDPALWVFGAWSGHRYADNTRYVFEWVRKQPGRRAVWLTHDERVCAAVRAGGGEAHMAWSPRGVWLACRAAATFVTATYEDVNPIGLVASLKVQLWHGTPLKKIGLDDDKARVTSRAYLAVKAVAEALLPFMRVRWDLLISPSPFVTPRLVSAFGLRPEQVVVTGYPRGDVILGPPPPFDWLADLRTRLAPKRVFLYAPTHRQEGTGDILAFDPRRSPELARALEAVDGVLLVKMHYYHRALQAEGSERIVWLGEAQLSDLNLLLPHVDVLLTDYSSVYFDYLLLNRPVVFTPFDLDAYRQLDRELYDDYEAITAGPRCRDWAEVAEALVRLARGEDPDEAARLAMRDRFNAFVDTESCRRVFELVSTRLQA